MRKNNFVMNGLVKSYLLILMVCFSVLKVQAQSVGGTISGAVSLCPNATNSGFLTLTGSVGTIQKWESSTDGGATWINTGNTIVNQSYFNITQTTCYRAIVKNGAFAPDTSSIACITIYAPSVGGTISGGGTFCVGSGVGSLNLTGNTGSVLYWLYSTNGGVSWTTVSNTTTFLAYPNITQNTIYRAVVQNGSSCPEDTSSIASIVIDPLTNAGAISGNDTVCYLANAGSLNLSGNVGTILNWLSSTNGGASWTTVTNTTASQSYNGLSQTTLFAAIVKSGTCNADTAFFTVVVSVPFVNAGVDTTIMQGQTLTLKGVGTGKPLWAPSAGLSNDTVLGPTVTPAATSTYVLTITDAKGCTNRDTVIITVTQSEFKGLVSNLFTPNGDGINDTWHIENIQVFPGNEVIVYNIYGNEVYQKKDYANDWKGTYNGADLPDGTYYYILKFDKPPQVIKGSLDILRSK